VAALWIDRYDANDDGVVGIRLEGELAGAAVTLLEEECRLLLATTYALVIDLAGLTYVSPTGLGILAGLEALGVGLRNGSPLLQDLLHDVRQGPVRS
jgi:anti-anti-sigma factor